MANNILIQFSADTGGLDEANKKLEELKKKEQELIKTMDEAKASESKVYDSAKANADAAKALEDYNKSINKNTKEQEKNKKSIKDLSDAFGKLDTAIAKGAAPEYLKAVKKELSELITQMYTTGKISDDTFKQMSDKLNQLEVSSEAAGETIGELSPVFDDVGTAVKGLDKTLKATLWAFIIGLIAQAVIYLKDFIVESYNASKGLDKLNRKLEDMRSLSEKSASTLAEQIISLRTLQSQWNSLGDDLNSKKRFIIENKDAFNDLGLEVDKVSDAENILVNNTDKVLLALRARAKAVAAQEIAIEKYKEVLQKQDELAELTKKQSDADLDADLWETVKRRWSSLDLGSGKLSSMNPVLDSMKEETQKAIGELTEDVNSYFSMSEDSMKEYASLLSEAGIESFSKIAKKTKDTTLKYQQEINNLLRQERLKAISDDEAREVLAVKQQYDKKLDAIKGNSEKENILRAMYEVNMQADIEKIRDKYDIQRRDSELKSELSLSNSRLALAKKGSEDYYNEKEKNLRIILGMEANAVFSSSATEEEKNSKLIELNNKLISDLDSLWDEYYKDYKKKSVDDIKYIADQETLVASQKYADGKMSKRAYENELNRITAESLNKQIEARKQNGEDTIDLEQELADKRIQIAEQEAEARAAIQEELFNTISTLATISFDSQKNQIQQQLADLDHYYTTDAEKAKENKNLKLISEEEYNRRQLELKRKQAQAEKNQAIFNLVLTSGQAIARAFKDYPFPYSAVIAALVGVQTLAQLNNIRSQPLPKYWKGRKDGKGEFALVGEYGPELMYVPGGASIMPSIDSAKALNGDYSMMPKWNMPAIVPNFPVAPAITRQQIDNSRTPSNSTDIDYEKMAKTIAKYQKKPVERPVYVNFDKDGMSVTEGNTKTKYVNEKHKK